MKKNAIAGHSFASWDVFEAHLAEWEREVANVRIHGTTAEGADRANWLASSATTVQSRSTRTATRSVAADRPARGGDGCGRRGAYPPGHARGCSP